MYLCTPLTEQRIEGNSKEKIIENAGKNKFEKKSKIYFAD
ncbi:hypothetical protein SAMN06296427_1157 [Moheibacter sediminis]|uniref:Uncharacterized protein n=1 Tax=Moheibacter sediminis TaxID=1434700 RepID=A0A1W2D2X3_9FLAO|nr:hypothetical protein SAMN06296427_1157 [Moheibacter sediminis]